MTEKRFNYEIEKFKKELGQYNRGGLVKLLLEMKEENEQLKQVSQDYEDIVSNWFIDNWHKLSDEQKQSAHLELGIDIEYDGDVE